MSRSWWVGPAGRVRRLVYPQADVMRAELKDLRRANRRLTARVEELDDVEARLEKVLTWRSRLHDDMDPGDHERIRLVKPYTMTSWDKLTSLTLAVRYVVRSRVEGDFMECGVWKGGSVHLMARVLLDEGVSDRDLYLFDTFAGMTEPTAKDVDASGRSAKERMETSSRKAKIWAISPRQEVEEGLRTLDYPQERFHLVEGPVEETIPAHVPERIALLRLDTDWYASTRHELEHLWDRLVPGGVLVIDDYGSFKGAREATDEFFARFDRAPFLQRAGNARVVVKP